jgi:hypothetical protein
MYDYFYSNLFNDRDCTGINADLTKKIIEQYNGKCYLTIEELLLITENKK